MPTLQVRDLPQDLYDDLVRVAKEDNRSIAQETIVLLRQALESTKERMAKRRMVMDEIAEYNVKSDLNMPSPADLIREDRDR